MSTYTVDELFAMKAEKWAEKWAPLNTYVTSTAQADGAAWQPIGYISEEGIATTPEPVVEALKCGHCGRDWHTAPLTKRVADMVRNHRFDPTYKAAEDESPIECVGSDTYGPNRPHMASGGGTGTYLTGKVVWLDELITATINYTTEALGIIPDLQWPKWESSWTLPPAPWITFYDEAYQPLTPPCPPDLELDVKFGPEHWPVEHVALFPPHLELVAKVHPNEWREPIPLPASPGLDVSTLVEQFNKKHNWNGVNK